MNHFHAFTAPQARALEGYEIGMETLVYHRTASGKGWKRKPSVVAWEPVSAAFYRNGIESHRFFKNLGSSRLIYGYTHAGYIPVTQVLISPDNREKRVYNYTFTYREEN